MKKDEEPKPKMEPVFVKIGNASKPISLHPLSFENAVSSLLKVKPLPPLPKPEKAKR
jgi:hypothetical protein